MKPQPANPAASAGYPRYFRIAGRSINAYKVFLCIGIYAGALATAALASSSGLSPLRFGLVGVACALAGMIGARIYHLLVHASDFASRRSFLEMWDIREGGLSVFGGVVPLVLTAFAAAHWLDVSLPVLLDHLALGILVGGFWIRLGCVFNGCCVGRESRGLLRVHLHDTAGVIKPRVPVQFLEMAWWAAGTIGFLLLWPHTLPHGSYMLAVMAWYGAGRFFLEPLREHSDIVLGAIRIDQFVGAALAIGTGAALWLRGWG